MTAQHHKHCDDTHPVFVFANQVTIAVTWDLYSSTCQSLEIVREKLISEIKSTVSSPENERYVLAAATIFYTLHIRNGIVFVNFSSITNFRNKINCQ